MKLNEIQELRTIQIIEDRLVNTGYSGSNKNIKALIKSHNNKFGTMFKNIQDAAFYYKIVKK